MKQGDLAELTSALKKNKGDVNFRHYDIETLSLATINSGLSFEDKRKMWKILLNEIYTTLKVPNGCGFYPQHNFGDFTGFEYRYHKTIPEAVSFIDTVIEQLPNICKKLNYNKDITLL